VEHHENREFLNAFFNVNLKGFSMKYHSSAVNSLSLRERVRVRVRGFRFDNTLFIYSLLLAFSRRETG